MPLPLAPRPFSRMVGTPQQQSAVGYHMTAPVGGINTVSPASAMDASDCLYLYNLISFQYGLRVRAGWHEHCTNVGTAPTPVYAYQDCSPMMFYLVGMLGGPRIGAWPGSNSPGVRSILSFTASNSLKDRLFACTKEGIWDVTKSSSSPTLVYGNADGWVEGFNAGRGVGTGFTNLYGDHFYAYCDNLNGYLLYSEKSDSWTKITIGDGTDGTSIKGKYSGTDTDIDPSTFRFVMFWKNRLWFVPENSSTAVYLPVGQYAGIVDDQDPQAGGTIVFGARFKYGGALVGLWNWTVDGGAGIDDHLVGISTAGDVVIYSGTDPALPGAFGLKGVWWVGPVPPGRKIASSFGGDLFILSIVGCVPLSKLVAGYMIRDPNIYATAKIANLFNQMMTERGTYNGWEINIHPTDNLLVVMVPATPWKVQEQLVMSLASKGWSRCFGIPMSTMETWRGKLYFGTADNRVCINEGYVDGMTLDSTVYWDIDFSLLTSFQQLGSTRKKRIHMIRPHFMTDGTNPGYATETRWDFDLSNITISPFPVELYEECVWDDPDDEWDGGVAVWDDGVDRGGAYVGSQGMGTHVAIALRGRSRTNTTFVGFDITMDQGGLL